jgi:hypothetical protein
MTPHGKFLFLIEWNKKNKSFQKLLMLKVKVACLDRANTLLQWSAFASDLLRPRIFCAEATYPNDLLISTTWIVYDLSNESLSPLMLWVRISLRTRYTTLCDKVCQWLATGRWFSLGPAVFSTNKTDCHDIT